MLVAVLWLSCHSTDHLVSRWQVVASIASVTEYRGQAMHAVDVLFLSGAWPAGAF